MAGQGRIVLFSSTIIALCLLDEARSTDNFLEGLGIKDIISPQWIEDLKPGREASLTIEFEAFEFEDDPDEEAIDEVKPGSTASTTADPFNWDIFAYPVLANLPPSFRRHFAYLLLSVIGLLLYAFWGYKRNFNLVKRSSERLSEVLNENFAYIADEPRYFEVCSWNRFRIYASGRTSCDYINISFKLLKRQCPWHELLLSKFTGAKDTVLIELALPAMDAITLAITKKMTNKKFLKNHQELVNSTYVLTAPELPDTHRAYVSSKERCVTLYSSYIIAKLEEFFPQLTYLYIVDAVPGVKGYNKHQRIRLELEYNQDVDWLARLVDTMVHVVDFTKNYTIKDKTRDMIEKTRQDVVASIFKEEIKRAQEEAKEELAQKTNANVKKQEKGLGRPTQRVRIIR